MTHSFFTPQLRGALAIGVGAGLWGLFWIPLRYLSEAGFGPFWSAAMAMGAGLPVALLAASRWGKWRSDHVRWMALVGGGIGISEVCYFYAVVSTDVIRAIFLFYMLPIWATLIDRVVFGVRLNPWRAFAILLAFAGLWLLLGGDGGLPVPRNAGDWAGLVAGFFWGFTLSMVRGRAEVDPYWNVASAVFFGTLFAALAAVLIGSVKFSAGVFTPTLAVGVLAFGILVFWPSMIGQLWGARLVPATRAALLTMTEIVVATISAWALIGTSMTTLSVVGGLVIVVAVLIDIYGNTEQSA
ncbi:EamA family transporter [Anderseniella sp. Alg231-50]|uniref:EamA family transporter n=1 Tax=Anderseniella sp. Alg231-50 TaxID=1922226 RepID=UPI000D560C48